MNETSLLLQTWGEARTRFSDQLNNLQPADLRKKLRGTKNSAGFLIRHIAEVELLFAKNVFGNTGIQVHAKTVIAKMDTGEWTDLDELISYQNMAGEELRQVLEARKEDDWNTTVNTREFGTKTKAEALGRIISHTAYHAGQLALTLKYGVEE